MISRSMIRGASPYSTGGGGTVLEHLYGAVLLSHILTGTPVPALGDHVTPTAVRFQAKAVDDVDDIHIIGTAQTGARLHLSVGVRRRPKLTAADHDSIRLIGTYLATIAARWPLLQSRRWNLALAVASVSVPAHQLAELSAAAAAAVDSKQFRMRMVQAGHPGKAVLGRLEQLDSLVAAALQRGAPDGGVGAAEATWRLLSRLSVVELRLEGSRKEDRSHAVGRLQHVTPSGSAAEGDALFSRLVEKTGAYAPAGATVTRESLLADLQGLPCLRVGITAALEPDANAAQLDPAKVGRSVVAGRPPAARPQLPRELWQAKQRLLPATEQPLVCENTLLLRHGCRLFAFDALTGDALWTERTAYEGRPAVGGGTLYIADRNGFPLPRDLRTGSRKAPLLGGIIEGCAVYDRGTLYAPDSSGLLHATDTASRTRIWTLDTHARISDPVLVVGDMVVVAAEAGPPAANAEARSGHPSRILSVDSSSGSLLWAQAAAVPGIEHWTATEHAVYAVYRSSEGSVRLTAIGARHGERQWDAPLSDAPTAAPVAVGGMLYLTGQQGTAYAIDAGSGDEMWSEPVGTRIIAPPVVVRDRVLVACHTPGVVTALHARTGKPTWPKPRTGKGAFVGAPYPVGDTAWTADRAGYLHAWEIDTGKPLTVRYQDALWDRDLQGSPPVVDGVLYFVTRSGTLRALRLG